MKIEDSINNKNKDLYFSISNIVNIDFILDSSELSWTLIQNRKDSYCITYPENIPSAESLTHELLHIELEIRGFTTTKQISEDNRFRLCHSLLIEAINNNLAHFRMLDDYINLGFDKSKFLYKIPTDFENEYFSDLIMIDPKVDPIQFMDFLLQTSIEMNWLKTWLALDTTKITADLISKNKILFENTNTIIDKWKKNAVSQNIDIFLVLQKVHNEGLKVCR